jgi:hypothetical protein
LANGIMAVTRPEKRLNCLKQQLLNTPDESSVTIWALGWKR